MLLTEKISWASASVLYGVIVSTALQTGVMSILAIAAAIYWRFP